MNYNSAQYSIKYDFLNISLFLYIWGLPNFSNIVKQTR